MEFLNGYLFLFKSFIIIKKIISSSNLLLYHFIQQLPFHHCSRLITGFTICIYRRENKADTSQNSSFYPFIINYYIIHIQFYPNQTYNKATIDFQYQQHSSIGPSVFLYQISNNNITIIHQTK